MPLRLAVVGAGWAGLAAALEASRLGAEVALFEMAPGAGGRARDLGPTQPELDNGQHIAIGAYAETLALMARLGVPEGEAFVRMPLRLVDVEGRGLRLPGGPAMPAFARAVLGRRGWRWRSRFALLRVAAGWQRAGFTCAPEATVTDLARTLPDEIRRGLIEPLCVAALNTQAEVASGATFLRVLKDSLAAGPGAADLLLPRLRLSRLLPVPALAALERDGVSVRLARRVERIARSEDGWQVDGEAFDAVVVAASAAEAARLVAPLSPEWATTATELGYEPIVTVYASAPGVRLPEPMLVLDADAERPAQFVFDRGQLGGPAGLLAFVVSGAGAWLERGLAACESAVLAQAEVALRARATKGLQAVRTIVEKRATFRCTPGLHRPPAAIAAGLVAAGDYVDGPYPATLEGAVRSGLAAARALLRA